MENRLNELNGSQWLYWTNTIYETNFPPDLTFSLRKKHGAMKPPELMAEIIAFFTKSGESVFDPFAGVGGTLLGAELVGRQALGVELNPLWVGIYQRLAEEYRQQAGTLVARDGERRGKKLQARMVQGDCLAVMRDLEPESVAAIITDPPYGCNHRVTGFRNETNFNMFSAEPADFGNCRTYDEYLKKVGSFGKEAFRILQPRRYLVLLIGDRFHQGEYLPLGTLVAEELRKNGFKWKGLRIWWNKATQRPLKPYAIKSCFVPNITHQNILIMRKEE